MHHRRRYALILACLLSACADPVVVPPVGDAEAAFSCEQLAGELSTVRDAERAARAEDRAKPAYLLIVPAYVSWYRMEQAEEAARQRHAQLVRLYTERGCPPLEGTALPLSGSRS